MSVKAVKEFFTKIAGDEGLAEKVKAAGTDVDEVIRLGREKGLEFTAEDMKAIHDETESLVGEGLQAFLEKVSANRELAQKVEEAGTDLNEIIRLGKENGCEFTADNLIAFQNLTVKSDVELSDEELEKVAGGFVSLLVGAIAVSSVVLVGIVAGAAGAAGYVAGKGGK